MNCKLLLPLSFQSDCVTYTFLHIKPTKKPNTQNIFFPFLLHLKMIELIDYIVSSEMMLTTNIYTLIIYDKASYQPNECVFED